MNLRKGDSENLQKVTKDLIETKRQFSTLVDNLPGLVYRCRNDLAWTMEYLSDGCFELTGYKPKDLLHNRKISYAELVVKEDRDRIREEIRNGVITNQPFTFQYRIRCADGRLKWVLEKGRQVLSGKGEVVYLEGFISDISEQKNAELIQNAFSEVSKISYRSDKVDDLFRVIHKYLGMVINVDNFYVAMYDDRTDSITLPFMVDTKDHFAVLPAGKTLTAYVIESRAPLLANQQVIEKLSKEGKIDIAGTPARIWLGVPIIVSGKVLGVMAVQSYTDASLYTKRDLETLKFVADQVSVGISKKKTEESFHKEKANLDQLFEGSHEAIIMTDKLGKVIKANSEFIKLFGYSPAEIISRHIDDLIADPDKRHESSKLTSEVLHGKAIELESQRKHKDGHLIDVSILGTPIVINGEVIGGYGIFRDITEKKRIEKNLIAAKEKAEESDKLKSAFLSNMSHEIRTPMNAILGFSSLLLDPDLSDEERTEFIHIITERGNDLMKIIDDIIDVAKIESGQIRIEIREVRINDLMDTLSVTLNEVRRKNKKTGVSLNCYPGNGDPGFTIYTDANRLRQIMTNLIENALKFTDKGSVDFGYNLKNIDSSPHIEFFVRDTGIGIPRNMQETVFERFRQVDHAGTRKYGGTGLGLTISKNLAQLLGGRISMESERGQGTTFYVLLPLRIKTGPAPVRMIARPEASTEQVWNNKVILVVEDEDSNYKLMERMLKPTGAKLVWVRNGIEAVEMCNSRPFDLVLMDIRMPMMDGYETTQIIKKDHRGLPVIAQTAYALKGEKEKSLAAGCDDYISKPIGARDLIKVLGKYLNKAE